VFELLSSWSARRGPGRQQILKTFPRHFEALHFRVLFTTSGAIMKTRSIKLTLHWRQTPMMPRRIVIEAILSKSSNVLTKRWRATTEARARAGLGPWVQQSGQCDSDTCLCGSRPRSKRSWFSLHFQAAFCQPRLKLCLECQCLCSFRAVDRSIVCISRHHGRSGCIRVIQGSNV
jgi:hypothetical protein